MWKVRNQGGGWEKSSRSGDGKESPSQYGGEAD